MQGPGKKLGGADAEKLLSRLFDGPEAERRALLGQLESTEPLTAGSVKNWAKKLMTLAQKGPKLAEKGRAYLYDDKLKKGLYLLGGKSGGNMLFFGLHGGGEDQGDAESAKSPWNGAATGEGWFAIFPEVIQKTEAAWGDEVTEKFVLDLIEYAKRTQKIDTNRIYLGGHSMGGYGTWTIGGRNADLFAGLMAFAGAATPYRDPKDHKTPVGIQEGILPNLRNIPIYVYHSQDDPNVDFATNDFAVKALDKLQKEYGGYVHRFDATNGRGHEFPDPKTGIEFVHKSARDPRPKKIVWQPYRSWKRMFYWIYWENPDPAATIVAEIRGKNEFELVVKDIKETPKDLSILLDERMADLDKEVVVRLNGKEVYRGKPVRSLAAMALTAIERRDPEMLFCCRIKL
jgi:predicted esterase